MNTTYLVLLILLIVYIPFHIYVRKSPAMKERGIVPYGPFVMFKTKRGIQHLDSVARYKRFWRVFGTISKIMALVLMAMILFIIIIDIILLPLMMDAPGLGVEYALALPGINPMLPLFYGVIGLVVAVAIHEIAHGIQSRANDMTVESTGLLYAVVPVGAFVEPNEEHIKNSSRKARTDMFAAGIAVNLTAAIAVFLLMAFGLMGSMSSQYGDNAGVMNVIDGSPAADAGIGFSSVILMIDDGVTVTEVNYDGLMDYRFSLGSPGSWEKHRVTYLTKDGPEYRDLYMGVFINSIAKNSPAEKATSSSAAEPGVPKNSFIVSIEKDGTVYGIGNTDDFRKLTDPNNPNRLLPGDAVKVVVLPYKDGEVSDALEYDVTLGNNNGRAYFGVTYSLSGLAFTTPDEVLAGAKDPLHNVDSLMDAPYALMSYIGKPFRGYAPVPAETQWWYQSPVLPDGMLWIVMQVFFWIFWLNLVLGVTNALPAVPFDGGYLFRDGVGAIVDRTHKGAPEEKREKITNTITSVVSYAMLFALLLVMMAMIF